LRGELRSGNITLLEAAIGPQLKPADITENVGQTKAAACFFFGGLNEWQRLRHALHEKNLKIPCLVADDVGPLAALSPGDGALYQVTCFAQDGLSLSGESFAKACESRFHMPADLYACQAYDAVRLLAAALARAKPPAAGKLRTELGKRLEPPFLGCTGPFRFAEDDRSAVRTLFLLQREGERVRLLRKMEPLAKSE
jgi:ABC-type branched-subunit amino acid transport system substrate-binding protein